MAFGRVNPFKRASPPQHKQALNTVRPQEHANSLIDQGYMQRAGAQYTLYRVRDLRIDSR